MAFVNEYGLSISLECSELIKELRRDIVEFGSGEVVAVWCKEELGVLFFTNYDFITEDEPIEEWELENGEFLIQMTMGTLLPILEKQNRVF